MFPSSLALHLVHLPGLLNGNASVSKHSAFIGKWLKCPSSQVFIIIWIESPADLSRVSTPWGSRASSLPPRRKLGPGWTGIPPIPILGDPRMKWRTCAVFIWTASTSTRASPPTWNPEPRSSQTCPTACECISPSKRDSSSVSQLSSLYGVARGLY